MPALRPRVIGGDAGTDGRISVGAGQEPDSTLTAITKWVPIEVIAFYEAFSTPFGADLANALWYIIVAGALVTALWTAFATEKSNAHSKIAWRQVILSSFAFFMWVVGTTSPDVWKVVHPWWRPGINSAVLAVGAVALPIIDGILRRLGLAQD